MKKTARTVTGISTLALAGIAVAMHSSPAAAWALIQSAGTPLSALPGLEALALGLVGLACLGLARQRAAS